MPDINDKLIQYLQEAQVMESNVRKMLDSMIKTTADLEIRADLEHHLEETKGHESSLKECLALLGAETKKTLDVIGALGTLLKGGMDQARGDKPIRNARDGYATEHAEIAMYQSLERLAQEAGRQEVAEVARRNRADEEAMARRIAASWDKVVKLTLKEEGVGS